MTEPPSPPPGANPPPPRPPAGYGRPAPRDDTRSRIIRRAPTAPMPAIADQANTTFIPRPAPQFDPARRPPPARRDDRVRTLGPSLEPSARTAVGASAASIVSGWATSVVATDLIAGWWRTDKLFCLAVAFLATVFAVATVAGVILLVQRRRIGRRLVVVGAVVALLTQLGVFLTDARVAWIVYLLPLLPVAAAALALHPDTKRYLLRD